MLAPALQKSRRLTRSSDRRRTVLLHTETRPPGRLVVPFGFVPSSSGYALDRATVRQKKTGRPVRFELTDQTRLALDDYLRLIDRKPGHLLFAGCGNSSRADHATVRPAR